MGWFRTYFLCLLHRDCIKLLSSFSRHLYPNHKRLVQWSKLANSQYSQEPRSLYMCILLKSKGQYCLIHLILQCYRIFSGSSQIDWSDQRRAVDPKINLLRGLYTIRSTQEQNWLYTITHTKPIGNRRSNASRIYISHHAYNYPQEARIR